LLVPSVAGHGEGSVWFAAEAVIRWVDVFAGDVLTLGDRDVTRTHLSDYVAMMRPCTDGTVVVATRDRIVTWDPRSDDIRTLVDLPGGEGVRLNEGSCTPTGDLLIGGLSSSRRPECVLSRVSADGSVATILDGITVSNGLGFLADGRSFYYTDSVTGRIDRVGYEDGAVVSRAPFVELGDVGGPDGLCVDSEDGVWVAVWGGSAVHHYTSDGILDRIVSVPTPHVTSVAIGGSALDTLYITTSSRGLPAPDPLAGSLFVAPVRTRGVAPLEFAV
jgi:sugar lactone lactonase YvrE